MRRIGLALLLLAALPTVCHAAPSVQELVNAAVEALRDTSYSSRMRFISHQDMGETREVNIYHVAPELYRIEQLSGGKSTGEVFIENGEELVRISRDDIYEIPVRQFSMNDSMTTKFLRDLGKFPGTTVLNGMVGMTEVWMLRQDSIHEKPYTVTVGLDKKSSFPLYLMVNDASGKPKVYYEMTSFQRKKPTDLPDKLFTFDADSLSRQTRQAAPQRATSGAGGSSSALPLYPGWLPKRYRVEAVSALQCPLSASSGKQTVAPMYQIEIYGPGLDLISIFQMREDDCGFDLKTLDLNKTGEFVVSKRGEWLVAAMGSRDREELERMLEKLEPSPQRVMKLLELTAARDAVLADALYR
jgi:outer membrane lipoprotein-sorting protein